MRAQDIIDRLDTLTVSDLERVHTAAGKLLAHYKARQNPDYNTKEPQDKDNKIFYRQEYTKCGKASCKKCQGQGHGPYWYAYWSKGGRTRSKYIGKSLPTDAPAHAPAD